MQNNKPYGHGNNSRDSGGNQNGYQRPSLADTRAEMLKPEEIPSNCIDLAQSRMENPSESEKKLTTSKIRGFLSMITAVYNVEVARAGEAELLPQSVDRIQMIRVRIAYEVGRDTDRSIENFVKKTHLLNYLGSVGKSRDKFIKFARYMEALVAYHRFYGGRD